MLAASVRRFAPRRAIAIDRCMEDLRRLLISRCEGEEGDAQDEDQQANCYGESSSRFHLIKMTLDWLCVFLIKSKAETKSVSAIGFRAPSD